VAQGAFMIIFISSQPAQRKKEGKKQAEQAELALPTME